MRKGDESDEELAEEEVHRQLPPRVHHAAQPIESGATRRVVVAKKERPDVPGIVLDDDERDRRESDAAQRETTEQTPHGPVLLIHVRNQVATVVHER